MIANDCIDEATLSRLPHGQIDEVIFYKPDEITTDLICCDIAIDGQVLFFHEETDGWDRLMDHLYALTGFRSDWYQCVSQPPFATSKFVAFKRNETASTSQP